MRYGPSEQLVALILEFGSSRIGLTVPDIMERFKVSRRTAERLLSAAQRLVALEEGQIWGDRHKLWRLKQVPMTLTGISADDLAALDLSAATMQRQGLEVYAETLRRLGAKLKATLRGPDSLRIETDLEALAEAEGFASRRGPRPKIDPDIFDRLRFAMKARRKVKITYLYRGSGLEGFQTVHPYGFLYGARHYLIAYSENERSRDLRSYALGNIRDAALLEDGFTPIDGFSLATYTVGMFGVFREEPVRVVWRFSSEAAADARDFLFHPTQADDRLAGRPCRGHVRGWRPTRDGVAPVHLGTACGDCRAALATGDDVEHAEEHD